MVEAKQALQRIYIIRTNQRVFRMKVVHQPKGVLGEGCCTNQSVLTTQGEGCPYFLHALKQNGTIQ